MYAYLLSKIYAQAHFSLKQTVFESWGYWDKATYDPTHIPVHSRNKDNMVDWRTEAGTEYANMLYCFDLRWQRASDCKFLYQDLDR